jgi:hypothetical protein
MKNIEEQNNMDMTQAAIFLAGSILTMIAFIVIVIGIVIINNIIHKHWKTITIWKFDSYPPIYEDPVFTEQKDIKKTK